MLRRNKTATLLIALTLLICAGSLAAQEHEIYVENLGDGLLWSTSFEYGYSDLQITGPKKYTYTDEYGREQVAWNAKGAMDGQYRWQISYRNELPGGVVEELKKARLVGDEQLACDLVDQGVIRAQSFSGYFAIVKGEIIVPKEGEEEPTKAGPRQAEPAAALAGARVPTKDFVILDDLIVDGSACIGFDCVNGESFGFDTIRLKENNLRIKFQDTSAAASYPSNDWELVANDSANGGANKFSIVDVDGGRTPFTVEARAPSHSLYVDDGGRVGFGTSIPVADLHVKSGNTPTLRLEQDGTSGFAPQTWDVAGNETNFFIRDATNGSTLPIRLRPGAPSNALHIIASGDVGLGTASPDTALHVRRTNGDAGLHVEEASGTTASRTLMELENNGQLNFVLARSDGAAGNWSFAHNGTTFDITKVGTGFNELSLNENGNLTIRGSLLANSGADTFPDYVFEDDYQLRTLDEVAAFIAENGHLPNVMSRAEVQQSGAIDVTRLQLQTLEKVEELTLYTLAQQELIQKLEARIAELEGSADD